MPLGFDIRQEVPAFSPPRTRRPASGRETPLILLPPMCTRWNQVTSLPGTSTISSTRTKIAPRFHEPSLFRLISSTQMTSTSSNLCAKRSVHMSSKNFLNIKLRQSKSVTVLKRNRVTLVPSLDIVDTFLFVVCSLHIFRSLSVCSLLSSPSNKKQKTKNRASPYATALW